MCVCAAQAPVDELLQLVPFDAAEFHAVARPGLESEVIVGVQSHILAVQCRLEFIRCVCAALGTGQGMTAGMCVCQTSLPRARGCGLHAPCFWHTGPVWAFRMCAHVRV